MLQTKRNILITGGSGTLGRAILRTARREGWRAQFTVYSRSELRQAEMKQEFPDIRYILGDVRDYDKLAAATAGHDCVIHAAAMKRIPECEAFPRECMETNVTGSSNVVRACINAQVATCIGISTDKACAAITTYGASKRMLEGLFQGASDRITTFTLVRYGNVLESNGSVLLNWKHQFETTGRITITSLAMSRFWMSENEAVQCIKFASDLERGQIAVPRVKGMRLVEMAKTVAPTADIVVTGLRSREKLHEDLVHPFENAQLINPDYYVLTPAPEPGNISYTSANAPQLSVADVLQYLEEIRQ